MVIYVVEIFLNLIGRGFRRCFTDRWFLFDFTLVVTGAGYSWVLEPMMEDTESTSTSAMEQLFVLRLLRLLRLLRAVRGMRQVQMAWRLVMGMVTSANTMCATLGLLILMLFMFACVAVEVITKDQMLWAREEALMEESFSTLDRIILTLFQFVTLDSVAAIYLPLIRAKPVLLIFFVPIVMSISVVLMNLVTAVIVESALDRANEDKEVAKTQARKNISKLRPQIQTFFQTIDKSGHGQIHLEDVHEVRLDDLPKDIQPHIKVDNMEDLYWLLDEDCSGTVDEKQFVDGLVNLALDYSGKATIETTLMLKVLKLTKNLSNGCKDNNGAALNNPVSLGGVARSASTRKVSARTPSTTSLDAPKQKPFSTLFARETSPAEPSASPLGKSPLSI
jgi:voltage-gated sodium channel